MKIISLLYTIIRRITMFITSMKGVLKSKQFWGGVALIVAATGAAGYVPLVNAVSVAACVALGGCT